MILPPRNGHPLTTNRARFGSPGPQIVSDADLAESMGLGPHGDHPHHQFATPFGGGGRHGMMPDVGHAPPEADVSLMIKSTLLAVSSLDPRKDVREVRLG